MSDDIDVGKFAVDLFERYADRVVRSALLGATRAKNLVAVRLERTYATYLRRLLERYAKGKSFFVRSEMVPLYNYFVPLDLGTDLRRLERPDAESLGRVSPYSIMIGSGGSGKSMMMRHMVVSAIEGGERTPVPLELRDLNREGGSLKAALLSTVRSFGLDADTAFLDAALDAGTLTILLDGFDEVEHDCRSGLVREIQQLAQSHPSTRIVLSSRPDHALQGWDGFVEFRVLPLTIETAVELIQKAPFDKAIKALFTKDLRERLFDRHESFVSNPLLLSIMLLTYKDAADIPHKLSTYYGQAFDSLFHRHDAWKGGFQRDRRTELDVQEFGRAFASFALMSYDRRQLSFTRSDALGLVEDARAASMLSFDGEAFLDDAIQAVCLLIEDGLEITFAHRSFQDYFVARFIQLSPPDHKVALLERFIPRVRSDDVIPLLFEMDRYIVEKHYILPRLVALRNKLGVRTEVQVEHLVRYMQFKYSEITYAPYDPDKSRLSAVVSNRQLLDLEFFVVRHYPRMRVAFAQDAGRLAEAFGRECDGSPSLPTGALSAESAFVLRMAETGGRWSLSFLRALFEVEAEITRRLAGNQQTLQQLLAVPHPVSGTQNSRPSPKN